MFMLLIVFFKISKMPAETGVDLFNASNRLIDVWFSPWSREIWSGISFKLIRPVDAVLIMKSSRAPYHAKRSRMLPVSPGKMASYISFEKIKEAVFASAIFFATSKSVFLFLSFPMSTSYFALGTNGVSLSVSM